MTETTWTILVAAAFLLGAWLSGYFWKEVEAAKWRGIADKPRMKASAGRLYKVEGVGLYQ